MSPTNTSESSTQAARSRRASTSSSQRQTLRPPRPIKQRKIPKSLKGVPVAIYGVKLVDFMSDRGNATIQPPPVLPESAPQASNLHVTGTTPQDTENLPSSYLSPTDFVHSQIPASVPVYLGSEPSHRDVPVSFLYNLDFNGQAEDIFSLTSDPCQSESYGRYDHFIPSSNSTGGLSGMEHNVGPYQQWLPEDSYSNASCTFPGSSDDIYGEFTGSSHLSMINDGTGTPFPFPTSDVNNLQSYFM